MMELIGKDEQFWMGLLITYLINVSIDLSTKLLAKRKYLIINIFLIG